MMRYILIAIFLSFTSVGYGESPPHDKIIYICGCGSDYEVLENGFYRCTNRANHFKMINKSVYSLLEAEIVVLKAEIVELRKVVEGCPCDSQIIVNLCDYKDNCQCGCQSTE